MAEIQILVVEDESIVAEDIRRSLQKLGYAVPSVVASGEEAVKKVEEISPDMVLMDIMLAGEMDGIEAADKIRSNFNVPVVYLTAYSDGKILERAKLTEPFGYIIKPFKERELQINVEIALYKYKMERKLKESKEWFSTTLRSIGDAVVATDSKNCVIFMNPVARFLTGWKLEDASGKALNEVFNIVNEDADVVENPVAKAANEGVVVEQANQTVLISRDGTKIPIDENIDPIKDDKGNIIGSVLVFRDITERRQAEEEIRGLKEFYENVLESIVTGVWVTDKNDIICYANKGMEAIAGLNAQQIVGIHVLKDFQEMFKPYYLRAKETLQPFYYAAVPFAARGPSYQSGWLIPRVKNGNFNGMICTIESIPKHEHVE